MKLEDHKDSFEAHRKTIFSWAIEVQGLSNSQRIVGVHASRGIIELLSLFLHGKNLVKSGFQLNHRWFKSQKVYSKIPNFKGKKEIIDLMVDLEKLCELLSYGKKRSTDDTEKAIKLFKELEEKINKLL